MMRMALLVRAALKLYLCIFRVYHRVYIDLEARRDTDKRWTDIGKRV